MLQEFFRYLKASGGERSFLQPLGDIRRFRQGGEVRLAGFRRRCRQVRAERPETDISQLLAEPETDLVQTTQRELPRRHTQERTARQRARLKPTSAKCSLP